MAGALIVTAEIAQRDFSWLEGLRRAHYPPDRNQVPAHLTIFHALPPSAEPEVRSRLASLAKGEAPKATIEGLMNLGAGVAYRIVSPELERIRDELADGLHGLLTAQDSGGWRPHITIQNKVAARVARALLASRRFADLARRLHTLVAEVTELTERVDNALQVTEDVYLARVYATAIELFRVPNVSAAVDRKLAIIREAYTALHSEAAGARAEIMEAAILALIAVEIVLSLLRH